MDLGAKIESAICEGKGNFYLHNSYYKFASSYLLNNIFDEDNDCDEDDDDKDGDIDDDDDDDEDQNYDKDD